MNFGRIKQQVRANKARVNQLKFDFQNRVLAAQQEVETSMIEFTTTNEEYKYNLANEKSNREAARIVLEQYKAGDVDFGRVFVVQSNMVQAQDTLVANRASIALALINTYRSLGGGWEIRCGNTDGTVATQAFPTLDNSTSIPFEPATDLIQPINARLLEDAMPEN